MRARLFLLSLVLAACGSTAPADLLPVAAPVAPPEAEEVAPDLGLAPGGIESNRGRLVWPVDGTVMGFFGPRTDPETGTRTEAVGLDISTAPGAPVRAAFGGRVSRVGAMVAFGTYVMLTHDGHTTVYGNLSRVDVARADTLGPGAVLGASGTREQPRGARLFFAVFEGQTPTDPLLWLRPRETSTAND
ncbi:MAG: peptidoglycan DD-metalloendopeptidase family protein [Bacteroidota bacterium]